VPSEITKIQAKNKISVKRIKQTPANKNKKATTVLTQIKVVKKIK
jgi:hypothetical protein